MWLPFRAAVLLRVNGSSDLRFTPYLVGILSLGLGRGERRGVSEFKVVGCTC